MDLHFFLAIDRSASLELIGAPLFIWWQSRLSKYQFGQLDD